MKKIFTLILSMCFFNSFTQVTKQLDSTIYASQPIGTSATAVDNDGNTYLSYYDELVSDQIFIKINSCGQKVWQVTTPAYKFSNVLKLDNNNDPVLVCDTFNTTGTSQKMYRFDKNNGNLLNQKKLFPNSLYIRVFDILFDANNNVLLLGANESNYAGIVVKYSANFNLLWTKVGSYNQFKKGIILNNKIYCLTETNGFTYTKIIGLNLTTGAQVLQIDGNTAQATVIYDFDIYNNRLFLATQAKIVMSDTLGILSTFATITGSNNQNVIANSSGIYVNYDSLGVKKVYKFNQFGNEQKRISLQIRNNNMDGAFFKYANSKLFIVGVRQNGSFQEKEINILDTLLNVESIKVDTNISPNSHYNKWFRFSVNNSGEYLLFGNSCESGLSSCAILKIYANCLVTSVKQIGDNNSLTIFPNPANNVINISGLAKQKQIISITNVLGKCVKLIETNNTNELSIDVKDLTTGMYFINYNNQSYKFIKE